MANEAFHNSGVAVASKVFAGPCTCGPAIHFNLEDSLGHIFATAIMNVDECEEMIKQIRSSKRLVMKSLKDRKC